MMESVAGFASVRLVSVVSFVWIVLRLHRHRRVEGQTFRLPTREPRSFCPSRWEARS
jgi:hypothetical protein